MPTLKITDANFKDVLVYETTLKQLNPLVQLDNLNAYLIYSPGTNYLTMIVREVYAFVQITIPAVITPTWENGEEGDVGVAFNYQLLFQTLHAYSVEVLAKMVLTLKFEEKSVFRIEVPGDKVHLAHVKLNATRIDELFHEAMVDYPSEDIAFQLSLLNDGRADFMEGLGNCLEFVSPDDRKNNAVALYNNRMIVNDIRHVFVYDYLYPVTFMSDTDPISLHKKSAKLLFTMNKKGIKFDATITKDGKRIFIVAPNFQAILNNAMSNIAPPGPEEFAMIEPATIVARVTDKILLDSADFFAGFYQSSQEFKSIRMQIEKDAVILILRDDKIADFSNSNVERRIETATNDIPAQVDFLHESLSNFLKVVDPAEDIEVYLDDKPSLMLWAKRRKIYLSKLGE